MMLGKQLWRLIEKLNTLFARVFKGRYYRNASPLEPIRSYYPSYGWRSIISVINKEEGGLGFKDLTDFNIVMLGKQLWRLIEKLNTLFARVFKGRYYRNASPL